MLVVYRFFWKYIISFNQVTLASQLVGVHFYSLHLYSDSCALEIDNSKAVVMLILKSSLYSSSNLIKLKEKFDDDQLKHATNRHSSMISATIDKSATSSSASGRTGYYAQQTFVSLLDGAGHGRREPAFIERLDGINVLHQR